jgi:tRNA threonylcarbamoyl adenosine modification protein YeaZ
VADDRPPLRSGALGEDDRVLAFDTSGPIGSVVVAAGPEVLAREVLTQMGAHASALLPAIDHVLEAAGVDRGQLRGVIVGEGPGSFTGVRVAAATAKGLGHALGIPVWAVSSLAAAALASAPGPVRYVLFDARGERVYGACYGVGGASFEEMIPPHAGELRDVLDGDVPAGAVFLGDGAVRHRGVIKGAGFPVVEAVGAQTLADGLVTYVARACPAPVSDLAAWEPEYVRASSAERLWRS